MPDNFNILRLLISDSTALIFQLALTHVALFPSVFFFFFVCFFENLLLIWEVIFLGIFGFASRPGLKGSSSGKDSGCAS